MHLCAVASSPFAEWGRDRWARSRRKAVEEIVRSQRDAGFVSVQTPVRAAMTDFTDATPFGVCVGLGDSRVEPP